MKKYDQKNIRDDLYLDEVEDLNFMLWKIIFNKNILRCNYKFGLE